MGVISLEKNLDAEAAGEIRGLELLALKYVGTHSSIAPRGALNTQGKWPGTAPLNQGHWYFGLVPDEGLAYLENRDDLALIYADNAEAFAEALLSQNRLPDNVFGHGADPQLRDRVHDALGLEDPIQAGPIDAQLRDLAGVDEADDEDEDADRVSSLVEEYSRDQLKAAVKAVREDASEYSLQGGPGVTELAEYLASKEQADVHDALEAVEEGDD